MNGNAGGGGGGLAAPLTPIEISSNSSHHYHQNIRHIFAEQINKKNGRLWQRRKGKEGKKEGHC